MVNVSDKYKVDIDKLRVMQISVLKALKKTGEKHLESFHSTMSSFKFPERRVKCHDTKYYEEVIPEVNRILEEYSKIKR